MQDKDEIIKQLREENERLKALKFTDVKGFLQKELRISFIGCVSMGGMFTGSVNMNQLTNSIEEYLSVKCSKLQQELEALKAKHKEYIVDFIKWSEAQDECGNESTIGFIRRDGQFIRFGDLPKNNKSKNHLTGNIEKGLSVYDGVFDGERYSIVFPDLSYSACVSLSGVLSRKCFLVTGNVVGRGSDGEPLISNVKIIEEITDIIGGLN